MRADTEDEWRLAQSFALTGGVRMDHDQNFGQHFSPRLYGVWHAAERWTVKGPSSSTVVAPLYTFVDLGATYAVTKNVSVFAGIYNLFDKQVNYTDYGHVEDGRRYWMSVSVKF